MNSFENEEFICVDCETTGLDLEKDRIIEVACVRFTLDEMIAEYETLVDPEQTISKESIAIHNITDEMVVGKPKAREILSEVFEFVGKTPIVGHGVNFDIDMLSNAAKREGITCSLDRNEVFDTLRMARIYGRSPTNSLEMLRKHFHIEFENAHRAMADVIVNIEVFRQLVKDYRSKKSLVKVLSRPVKMKKIPLGKHKGRPFSEVPVEYLQWAANKDFDQDLLFSIRSELKRRKARSSFGQASNPFRNL